jgi:plastocyanin
MIMRKVPLALVVVLVLIGGSWAIYSHSKSNNSSLYGNNNASSPPPVSKQATPSAGAITIKNKIFTPSQITVAKGGTVTWTNNDNVAHTVIDDLSNVGGPASGDIPPGSTYSFIFNKTGSFQYHCKNHPSMRGTIVVK